MGVYLGIMLIPVYIWWLFKNTLKYRHTIDKIFLKITAFLKDWRNATSFIIAWFITNGWGWVFMFLGRYLQIKWMKYVGDAYIAFLWLPFVNEKIVTLALAGVIKKILSHFFK